ncbi:Hypothetical predicted protein [Octopus vulgaris]|uniref:Uncharacterized protein n=1 Tax=Octopus vulgaris TaxID=6645 RepID=A0AA36AQA9_OCTVU|nr:Hypothetical predicted protein [Octopus vulgaris]
MRRFGKFPWEKQYIHNLATLSSFSYTFYCSQHKISQNSLQFPETCDIVTGRHNEPSFGRSYRSIHQLFLRTFQISIGLIVDPERQLREYPWFGLQQVLEEAGPDLKTFRAQCQNLRSPMKPFFERHGF